MSEESEKNAERDPGYLDLLQRIVNDDVRTLLRKEQTYRGSWKKRGGVGAFMMLARKWDRLENCAQAADWDIFRSIAWGEDTYGPGADGTALAEIRDLRRYLALVEAWHEWLSRSTAIPSPPVPHPDFPVDEREMAEDDSQAEAEERYYWRGRAYRSKKEAEADDSPPPPETEEQRFARSLNFLLNESERSPMARHALDLLPMIKKEIDHLLSTDVGRPWSQEKAKRLERLRLLVTAIELAFVPPTAWGR